ncbi:unnamed protein product [Rotaria magnacalcarata]|uniref:Transducer of regulated CREB activity N-terminal domain-containing protein n=3 Tax=Rotaria magnacalcarata TaxID=392030 RepID=A0A816RGX5_9BILA|nr:unnamed protein product [Rotaria magnacalcarata]CAF2151152.1 unnamed protein product [Rotaria magnacalcarata]CAF3952670.1 unnamed protein product [Rotaria magnacalcarata]
MSSPRKFAEKIALIQQKQAEGDAAFKTIINEVEAAKNGADRASTITCKLDAPARTYEIANGINTSDNYSYINQCMKNENGNSFNRLLLPPDNSSWRRVHSDPSLHQTVMPTAIAQYHAQIDNEDNNQQLNYDNNDIKFDINVYGGELPNSHHLQVSNSQFQTQHYYDLNNNNYANNNVNVFYQSPQTLSIPQQTIAPSTNNTQHVGLGSRYSSGNTSSNGLLLPPNQQTRGSGGSLPDLRVESTYNTQQISFPTVPSSSTPTTQPYFRSTSPQQNNDVDLFALRPQQQQLISRIGPLKQSSSMRRRHSPIGDHRQSSPRRQHSPSPDVSTSQQNHYRMEPQSPQSQPSYSPQNSPNFLPSPSNELTPFSPPLQQQQPTDNQKTYFTLPNHFDQITLENNFYAQQQPSSPSSQQQQQQQQQPQQQQQMNFYPFMDDMSLPYSHNQTAMNITTTNQKSPTIPNIILTDVDSSKLDLSKELDNDFPNSFDSLLDSTDLQLNPDYFLLNAADLSIDPIICDDTFCMER